EKFRLSEYDVELFRKGVPHQYQSIFRYLRRVTKLEATTNNHITYYKNGETFFPDFIESIKKAKEYIFMEFFIIGEGKEWKAIEEVLIERAAAGVEVRLIYDDMGSFGLLPSAYPRLMREKGIKCYKFHPFRPILSGAYNNRDHRKIAVIDHQMGFTGGMNLADEYANDIVRFGYWKDTMVKIEGPAIANLIATFLQNYDLSAGCISEYDHYFHGEYPKFDDPGFCFPFGDGPGSYDGNEAIGEENYLQIMAAAQHSLWISTPYLIPSYRMMEGLKSAAKRGVDVKLFVPGIPDKKPVYWMARCDFAQLVRAGVKIYIYTPGFNHEKQAVADDRLAFCGTINFDFRSLTHHFECGATFVDAPCIKEMVEDFREMESVSQLVDKDYHVGAFPRLVAGFLRIFRTLF
ncbi:MAG: cardiolipin synthase, partial [Bacilli bacterium]|nr:cardiolipin synthase [Bacilli bacterium]